MNSLGRRGEIRSQSELFGKSFEHWVILEMRAFLGYSRLDAEMTYWRSLSQFEGDPIVGDRNAIEVKAVDVKAVDVVQDRHLKGLQPLLLQLVSPVLEEPPCPALTAVIPELAKGLLEQVSRVPPLVGGQRLLEPLARPGVEVLAVRK